jgi:hypothetical protein
VEIKEPEDDEDDVQVKIERDEPMQDEKNENEDDVQAKIERGD